MCPFFSQFLLILSIVLGFEGNGYSKASNDPGGATHSGITQRTYNAYRTNEKLPKKSVRQISQIEIQTIYFKDFYFSTRCYTMNTSLAIVFFDCNVNFGKTKARVLLNRILGFSDYRQFDDSTEMKIKFSNQDTLAKKLIKERIKERFRIVRENRKYQRFLRGWLKRDEKLYSLVDKYSNKNLLFYEKLLFSLNRY